MIYTVRYTRHFVSGHLAGLDCEDTVTRLPGTIAGAVLATMIDQERTGRVLTTHEGNEYTVHNPRVA